jgi:site-specific DNA-methyltransferase (adenine-specific)/adenine-specific DNA-methyltransferase
MPEARGARRPADSAALFPDARNRLIEGDCLALMRALPARSIDLIYVDPPFYSGRDYPRPAARDAAPTAAATAVASDGGAAADHAAAAFADRWEGGLDDYLAWLTPRLQEMHRLLRPTGSLFVHLDWHAVHYVKCALDGIFGYARFRNQIVWHYASGGRATTSFSRKHDLILWYSRSDRWTFNPTAVGVPRGVCPTCGAARDHWNHLRRHVDADGRVYRTIRSAGRVYRYYDDEPTLPPDVWLDVNHLQQRDPERLSYPTQKPEALLLRIVAACSEPGQVVADFFCGSGTTLAAAQRLGRRWLGVDRSAAAVAIAAARLSRLLDFPSPAPRRRQCSTGSAAPAAAPPHPGYTVERAAEAG